jgi:hypothetical protein
MQLYLRTSCCVHQAKISKSLGISLRVCVAMLHELFFKHSAREGRGSSVSLDEYKHG